MNILLTAWLLGRPSHSRAVPQALTVAAYAMVTAVLLVVLAGAWSFTTFDPEARGMYLPLAGFAVVLLVVPVLVLGAAAARLSARTQDRALSALRLVGATAGQVGRVALVQAVGTALVGALAGVLLYVACRPLVALVRFQGEALGAAMRLPGWAVAAAVAAVVLLSAASAVAGLRRLVITPLAVARRQDVPTPSWVRLLVTVGVLAVLYAVFTNLGVVARDLATMVVTVIGGFGLGLLVLDLVGPWLVGLVARRRLARAERPEQLLAARMVLEDPAASWCQVSGVAMASFVAVVGGCGAAMMQLGNQEPTGDWFDHVPGDVLTGVLLTLAITFTCVAASATISQCAATLDRAELYEGLHHLGMSYQVMNRARVASLMVPALTASIGFAVASTLLVLPLAGVALLLRPLTVAVVVGAVVLGMVLVRSAIALANPRRLLSQPQPVGP